MSDDTELVRRMAALAHLDVTDREVEDLGRQFADILSAFEALTRADLEGDPADAEPSGTPLRPDVERPSLAREEALANAPRTADGFFSVPKTIGGQS